MKQKNPSYLDEFGYDLGLDPRFDRAAQLLFRLLGLHYYMLKHPSEWRKEVGKKKEYYELLDVVLGYIVLGIKASEEGGVK